MVGVPIAILYAAITWPSVVIPVLIVGFVVVFSLYVVATLAGK